MEAVKAFNTELASLYDTKPPITKAKMMTISKSAMKAIKLYKHVVLAVEKFIQKVGSLTIIELNNFFNVLVQARICRTWALCD